MRQYTDQATTTINSISEKPRTPYDFMYFIPSTLDDLSPENTGAGSVSIRRNLQYMADQPLQFRRLSR